MQQAGEQVAEGIDFSDEWAVMRVDEDIDSGVERIGEAGRGANGKVERFLQFLRADLVEESSGVATFVSQVEIGHRALALPNDPMPRFSGNDQDTQIGRAAGERDLRNPLFADHSLRQEAVENALNIIEISVSANGQAIHELRGASFRHNADGRDELPMQRRPA